MNLIFTSKLYREEIKHWSLVFVLLLYSITVTVFAMRNTSKTILIGIDEIGTRIITDKSDSLTQNELKNFLRVFFENYYTYDPKNFDSKMSLATELMSSDLWESQKSNLIQLSDKLKKTQVSQNAEIESIDLLESDRIEAILILKIGSRLAEQKVRLKVNLSFKKIERTEKNPWGFEITELLDAAI